MTEVFKCTVGSYDTNCYLLRDSETGEAAAIDCAVFTPGYERFLNEHGITSLKYILLTHGHFDHVCGVAALKEKTGGAVCIYETEKDCLINERSNLNSEVRYADFTPCPADVLLKDGDKLPFGNGDITVRYTPGHTSGSVCFLYENLMFSGDTLFRRSMGRTDLPTGSTKQLFASLRSIGEIEGEYTIYPGHGEETALSEEKENNRYLRQRK